VLRDDRLASRRQLIDHGDIQIAVEGEGQRARNGRGRHDQHVGIDALLPEAEALHDTEAVLLVHDGQA
jgi:hypothetical protein